MRLFLALALVPAALALTAAAPAVAAPAAYKGKTSQSRTVVFKLSGGKVKGFTAGINMMCIQSGIEFNAVIPPKAMKVRGGRFAYEGRDRTDSTNIVIKGRVNGARVKGSVKMTDSRYVAYDQTFDSCSGAAKFTAKRR